MTHPYKGRTGIDRLIRALGYSRQGLALAYRGESAFRQEVWLTIAATPLALWLARTALEFVLLLSCLVLVMVVELLNSAVEAAVDRVGLERHELSARAKDMGSAAVLLTLAITGAVWGAIAWARWGS